MIYRYELRRQLSGIIAWSCLITAVLLLMFYVFYPAFLDSKELLEEYLASFPKVVLAMFGLNAEKFFEFESFSAFTYLYTSVVGAIMASGMAIGIFAREKRNKCQEFLYTKPIRRGKIFQKKFLCGLTLLFLSVIPYLAVYLISYIDYTKRTRLSESFLYSIFSFPFTLLLFYLIGITASVFLKKIRSGAGLSAGIGIFAFILAMLQTLTGKEFFKYISPLNYFNPGGVFQNGSYDRQCVITAIVLMIFLLGISYVKYVKADIFE